MTTASPINIESIERKIDNKYFLALLSLLWSQSLFDHLRGFFTHIPIVGGFVAPYIVPAIILFLVLKSRKEVGRYVKVIDVLFVLALCLFYFINTIVYPNNAEQLAMYSYQFFLCCLPFFFAGLVFRLGEQVEKILYWTSVVDMFILVAYYLMFVKGVSYSGSTELREDMMGPAYAFLPFLIVIFRHLMTSFSWESLILSLVGFIFLLSLGTRGPVVCLLVFIVVYLVFFKKYKRPFLSPLLIIIGGSLVYFNLDSVIEALALVMGVLGMSTRVLHSIQLIGGNVDDASVLERQIIALDIIRNVSISGHGLASVSNVSSMGIYSHNIILDFWIEYGSLFGSLLLVAIIVLFLKAWRKGRDENQKSFVLVMFCISIVNLLFSHTYLITAEFYFALGYCVHVIRNSKVRY